MDFVVVNLNNDEDTPEFPNKDNVGHVEILENNRVMITLSKNGLIGFAQELLRLAYNDYKSSYHVHVDPSEKGYLSQAMGFFSMPNSDELIISCGDFEPIDSYLKEK
ncbi:hypothetical protein GC096_30360 [Paenibacillus sp. LMG 31461]|uniref:Uncharacterized protein n=1 Tax=Paenibacillus plantarum TaxID=2654975 RepID=A0ABX1XII8_9BACL|nr:hypothetical protein [Paenibacillus plantarum]NOU68335.1 hypothetical protein [Paenibacillus plantarum]